MTKMPPIRINRPHIDRLMPISQKQIMTAVEFLMAKSILKIYGNRKEDLERKQKLNSTTNIKRRNQ